MAGSVGGGLLSHLLDDAVLPTRGRYWQQLSGSADVLTVLACSELDALTHTLQVHVQLHNSGGFKIPTFKVHLLTSCNTLARDPTESLGRIYPGEGMGAGGGMGGDLGAVGTSTLPSSPSATFTQASVLVQAGAEFLLPGAYVERTLSMCALRVAPLSAVLRVEYADLVYDEDDLFEIPLEHKQKRRTRGP
ncbi:hypothetical protein B484DRAFT_412235, partial [Ochromonadaceae sp. CCMP2298]